MLKPNILQTLESWTGIEDATIDDVPYLSISDMIRLCQVELMPSKEDLEFEWLSAMVERIEKGGIDRCSELDDSIDIVY